MGSISNGLTWSQATMNSIEQLRTRYRIHYFPTILLIDPKSKIVSLGQTRKKQPGSEDKSCSSLFMSCFPRRSGITPG